MSSASILIINLSRKTHYRQGEIATLQPPIEALIGKFPVLNFIKGSWFKCSYKKSYFYAEFEFEIPKMVKYASPSMNAQN